MKTNLVFRSIAVPRSVVGLARVGELLPGTRALHDQLAHTFILLGAMLVHTNDTPISDKIAMLSVRLFTHKLQLGFSAAKSEWAPSELWFACVMGIR